MSIPLYYALSPQEAENCTHPFLALLGYGFYSDGSLCIPKHMQKNAPIVINDAIVAQVLPKKEAISELARLCSYGCFLDFERPPTENSISICKQLSESIAADAMLAVPKAYCAYLPRAAVIISPQELPNSWTKFCKQQQHLFQRWVLEVIPCNKRVNIETRQIRKTVIENAKCLCRQGNGGIFYYDSIETVKDRLEIAQYYGCIAGIGLKSELESIQKAQQ